MIAGFPLMKLLAIWASKGTPYINGLKEERCQLTRLEDSGNFAKKKSIYGFVLEVPRVFHPTIINKGVSVRKKLLNYEHPRSY
jgi:hypothetical protein